jgi:hypothetical protein
MKEIKITLKLLGQDIVLIKHNISLYSALIDISVELNKKFVDIFDFITEIKVSEVL